MGNKSSSSSSSDSSSGTSPGKMTHKQGINSVDKNCCCHNLSE